MFKPNNTDFRPAYMQLKAHLLDGVQSGRWRPGEQIPSLRELVRDSGLSYLTVVKAISQLTRDGVLESRQGCGTFVRDTSENGARLQPQTLRIGIVSAEPIDAMGTPFGHEVILGMNSAAARFGHRFVTLSTQDLAEDSPLPEVDGAILMSADNLPAIARRLHRHLPVVLVNFTPECPEASSVDVDETNGVQQAIEHLVSLGHRRIAFARAASDLPRYQERYDAYAAVLTQHGIPLDPALVVTGSQFLETGMANMQRLLRQDPRPTAFFAGSDIEAAGAIRAAAEAGLRVPEDISVIGFLDLELFAHHQPRITTVHLPMKQMGYEAVRLLAETVAGERRKAARLILETRLIVRETTAPVATAGDGKDSTRRRGRTQKRTSSVRRARQ